MTGSECKIRKGPTFDAKSLSIAMAAYECTTLESDPSSATRLPKAAKITGVGSWPRRMVKNFRASAFRIVRSSTAEDVSSGAICQAKTKAESDL